MRTTAHSEFLKLHEVYLKTASAAFVSEGQLEKQWEPLNYLTKPDFKLAKQEYDRFEKLLSAHVSTKEKCHTIAITALSHSALPQP